MKASDVEYELKHFTDNGQQAFITCSQLTKALGRVDQSKVRAEYLTDLEAVDHKYYLIKDVAKVLKSHCAVLGGKK